MDNLKWQSVYSILRLLSSFLVVPVIFANSDTSEVLIYGYCTFITALTVGLDLGMQSVGIARISKEIRNTLGSFGILLITLRRMYFILTIIAVLIFFVIIIGNSEILNISYLNKMLLGLHAMFSLINLRGMWQEAVSIGTKKLDVLRKVQSISLILLLIVFYVLSQYNAAIISFIIANGIYIITMRLVLFKILYKYIREALNDISKLFNFRLFFQDLKFVFPVSVVALLTGRVIYYIGLTNFDENLSALFVAVFTIISFTGFAAMIYRESKAFDLTQDIRSISSVFTMSIIWQTAVYILSFIVLFFIKDLLVQYRPELSYMSWKLALVFYFFSYMECIAGLISLVLLNNQKYGYVKWYSLVMLTVVSLLILGSNNKLLSLYNVMSIALSGQLIYVMILSKLLYDYWKNQNQNISTQAKA